MAHAPSARSIEEAPSGVLEQPAAPTRAAARAEGVTPGSLPGERPKSGYLPSLDGWRAVAICGVMMTHDRMWHLFGKTNVNVRPLGGLGVWLFFSISGLLICGRILEDESRLGHFNIRSFYIRRFFRIQPAQWMYLAFVALLVLAGVAHERWSSLLSALFLYKNFCWNEGQMNRMLSEQYFTGHFWTLAVEEHFYILLSAFLFFCKRRRMLWLGVGLAALIAVQQIAKVRGLYWPEVSLRRTYWQIQFLLLPALLAMVLRLQRTRDLVARYLKPWVAFVITVATILVHKLLVRDLPPLISWPTLMANAYQFIYVFNLWVVATMTHGRSWTTRLLELAPVRYVGRLSYSLYLWHILFFSPTQPMAHITFAPLVWLATTPLRYVAAFAVAAGSYHLIEKPMIRLGHKLAPPATPGHADLRAA